MDWRRWRPTKFEPRRVTLEEFWYWCNERHHIYKLRKSGLAPPWTNDFVLQTYRFTNVFRQDDRGTRYLWDTYLDECTDKLCHFATIVLYRMFNNIDTAARCFPEPIYDWDLQRVHIAEAMQSMQEAGTTIFGGAYIMRGPWWNHLSTVDYVWKHREVINGALVALNVNGSTRYLCQLPNVSTFTANQLCQDMRHHLGYLANAPDGHCFAFPGPGAKRCLRWMGYIEDTESMQELCEMQNDWRAPHLPTLEVQDIQQSLCEVQKYHKLCLHHEHGENRPKFRIFDTPERKLL